jgi:hypothetical protein
VDTLMGHLGVPEVAPSKRFRKMTKNSETTTTSLFY